MKLMKLYIPETIDPEVAYLDDTTYSLPVIVASNDKNFDMHKAISPLRKKFNICMNLIKATKDAEHKLEIISDKFADAQRKVEALDKKIMAYKEYYDFEPSEKILTEKQNAQENVNVLSQELKQTDDLAFHNKTYNQLLEAICYADPQESIFTTDPVYQMITAALAYFHNTSKIVTWKQAMAYTRVQRLIYDYLLKYCHCYDLSQTLNDPSNNHIIEIDNENVVHIDKLFNDKGEIIYENNKIKY